MAEPIEPPVTLSEVSSAAMEVYNSVKVSLADLCAKGTAQYARKNYEEASDLYARASELQAELNGEMSPDNAEILFLYGRSLFKVGQSKSDVLGGKAGTEKKKPNGAAKAKREASKQERKSEGEKVAEEGVAIIAAQNGSGVKSEEAVDAKKPLFQFTGDENFEDSDDDAEVSLTQFRTTSTLMLIRTKTVKVTQRRRKMILLPPSRCLTLREFYSQRNWRSQKRMQAKAKMLVILQ